MRCCRQAIALDKSGKMLHYVAARMIASGMSSANQNDVCYSILRMMWKWDSPFKMKWHEWTSKNGWVPFPWRRKKEL